jgi:hypothetical protein
MIPNTYNPLDWNRYSYTDYNPVNRTDPTGHDPNHDKCDYYGDCPNIKVPQDGSYSSILGNISADDLRTVSEKMSSDLTKEGGLLDQQKNKDTLKSFGSLVESFIVTTVAGETLCTTGIGCLAGIALATWVAQEGVNRSAPDELKDFKNVQNYFMRAANTNKNSPSNDKLRINIWTENSFKVNIEVQGMESERLTIGIENYNDQILPYLNGKITLWK